ncbi:MAG: phosphorylase, partial [Caulobacter vibrioides]
MRLPALVLACLCLIASPALAQKLDETPRVAVISAFPPEIGALNAATAQQKAYEVNGVRFMTGQLEGKPVVVFLSGVSMVNAAMTTQMALDRFNITRIVFSGIAGGVDEGLDIGDVVVADQWAQNLESAFARETDKGFEVSPSIRTTTLANYGMIFPRGIHMPGDALGTPARVWFPADAALLDTARKVA